MRFAVRFFLFAVCSALLSYGLFRAESPPNPFENADKVLHLLAFGATALSTRLAFPRLPGWLLWGLLLAAAPFSEWLQHYLQPTRQFSVGDILANLTGVVLAWLAWQVLSRLWRRYTAKA